MVNSKKVRAALPVPKKKSEEKSPEKLPVVEELEGSSHGKGKGKSVVSFWTHFCPSIILLTCQEQSSSAATKVPVSRSSRSGLQFPVGR